MTFEEILKLSFSLEQLGPWALSAGGVAGTAVWLAYKVGKSSMKEAVELSKLNVAIVGLGLFVGEIGLRHAGGECIPKPTRESIRYTARPCHIV